MRAVRIDGQTPGGKRNKLKDALPLDTPYMVQFFRYMPAILNAAIVFIRCLLAKALYNG